MTWFDLLDMHGVEGTLNQFGNVYIFYYLHPGVNGVFQHDNVSHWLEEHDQDLQVQFWLLKT